MSKKITLSNIARVSQFVSRRSLEFIGMLPKHKIEQVAYRMLKCPDCMEAGKCKHCGCQVPGRMYVDETCNGGERFGDMMSEDEWNEFKAKQDE